MIVANGVEYKTAAEYFRHLDRVAAVAVRAVANAQDQRKLDEMRYPLLNIQDWSWRTYERWKAS